MNPHALSRLQVRNWLSSQFPGAAVQDTWNVRRDVAVFRIRPRAADAAVLEFEVSDEAFSDHSPDTLTQALDRLGAREAIAQAAPVGLLLNTRLQLVRSPVHH
ncbi:MAG: hypothetical protein ACT4P7_19025 [Gemmatimonadaceae bacterium]